MLDSPGAIIEFCRHSLQGERNEVFQTIYLNVQNEVIEVETVAEGTVDHAAVYPRRIIEGALRHNAVGLIFVHNHPDGNAEASEADRRLTQALTQAAGSVGIAVYDHLIIGRDGCLSFRKHGWLTS